MDPYSVGILAGLGVVLLGVFVMTKKVNTDDDSARDDDSAVPLDMEEGDDDDDTTGDREGP
tara:strand:- start:589 stop:771 length:183 start_codon:yes stop_codon:yes gene_type:complete